MGSAGDSSNNKWRILILGNNFPATPIIHSLSHSSENYDIHIAHPHTPTSPPKHDHTTFHTSKINASALSPLLEQLKPDIVIDTSPGPFESSKKPLIDCLVEAGVPRFVPCEFGHDSLNAGIQDRLPASKERGQTIQYLRDLSSDGGKLDWCAVAVGVVLDRGILSRNLGFDLGWKNANMHGSGDESFAASSSSWIGEVMCAMVSHWDDVKERYLYAAGMNTSANEVLSALERETGKDWTADRGEIEDCVREAKKRIEMGFPDAGMFLMERSVLYDQSLDAAGSFEREDAKKLLGLGEGETLGEVVRGVVHEHEHRGGKTESCGCD